MGNHDVNIVTDFRHTVSAVMPFRMAHLVDCFIDPRAEYLLVNRMIDKPMPLGIPLSAGRATCFQARDRSIP